MICRVLAGGLPGAGESGVLVAESAVRAGESWGWRSSSGAVRAVRAPLSCGRVAGAGREVLVRARRARAVPAAPVAIAAGSPPERAADLGVRDPVHDDGGLSPARRRVAASRRIAAVWHLKPSVMPEPSAVPTSILRAEHAKSPARRNLPPGTRRSSETHVTPIRLTESRGKSFDRLHSDSR